jgi:hypothetical protein
MLNPCLDLLITRKKFLIRQLENARFSGSKIQIKMLKKMIRKTEQQIRVFIV